MDTSILISNVGFSEMYEWSDVPTQSEKFGKFVQFSLEDPGKIEPYHTVNAKVIGITTVEGKVVSDDPDYWKGQFYCNEYGDAYLGKDTIAVGVKKYDHVNEFSFIATEKEEELVPITTEKFDNNAQFVKRSGREEWVKVNLLGKVIVKDDGTLQSGDWCTPYTGPDKSKFGMAIKAGPKSKNTYYVIERISDNTILILNK